MTKALMVKLVNKGLKILALFGSASSSLAEGTTKMKKLHFIFDKNQKAQKLKKILLKRYKNFSAVNSNYIIVAGGDGFMLHILKRYYKLNKPFYGINCGTFGFLMNNYIARNLEKKIDKTIPITISPLELSTVIKKKNSYSY